MIYVFLVFYLFDNALAQSEAKDNYICPDLPAMRDLNLTAFSGTWFQKANAFIHESSNSCMFLTFNVEGDNINVVSIRDNNGEPKMMSGVAHKTDASGRAMLDLTFHTNSNKTLSMTLAIIATDYKTYLIIYNCPTRRWRTRRFGAIFTRSSIPSDAVYDEAFKMTEKLMEMGPKNFTICKDVDCVKHYKNEIIVH